MSNTDEHDKKPPAKTVAWDPDELPGLADDDAAASTSPPASTAPASTSMPTQRFTGEEAAPGAGAADPAATVMFTAEDVARLQEEQAAVEAEAAEEDPLIGTQIRDKWEVLKRLGAGSFGTVYKVRDVTGGWIEALKILGVDRLAGAEAEEMRARFLREAQIMKRLGTDSKHIVGMSTYEEDIEAGLVYFLMEFVEGRSLADALSEDGPFDVPRTVRLALQVCDGLMAAHEGPEPVVHRDLKLENLMLTTDRAGEEMVKILDFGIAKIAEREADSRLTTVGTLGTPGYAAPEQLRAEAVDGRTDLFAFGVILYALLTGRDPWLGNLAHEPTHQIYELMVATDRAEVRPMSDSGRAISPAMVNVVMKLLRRDPAQRFQSARELRDALLRIQEGATDSDTASLKVVTEDAGVVVEVREGRRVVAEGPTPLVANGLEAVTYQILIRDPRYESGETSVVLAPGSMQDVTLVTHRREQPASAARPTPRGAKKKGGAGRWVALLVLVGAAGATAWAQPWGRTLELDGVVQRGEAGSVTAAWLTDGGVEGGIQLVPIPAAASMLVPFFAPVEESGIPEAVRRLEAAGVEVDTQWEVRRLTDLARDAQARGAYFGIDGGDVRSYALRLAEIDPDNEDATSLLLKVGERMAWDAEVAVAEGPPQRAEELIDACLALVPGHPRCLAVQEGM